MLLERWINKKSKLASASRLDANAKPAINKNKLLGIVTKRKLNVSQHFLEKSIQP